MSSGKSEFRETNDAPPAEESTAVAGMSQAQAEAYSSMEKSEHKGPKKTDDTTQHLNQLELTADLSVEDVAAVVADGQLSGDKNLLRRAIRENTSMVLKLGKVLTLSDLNFSQATAFFERVNQQLEATGSPFRLEFQFSDIELNEKGKDQVTATVSLVEIDPSTGEKTKHGECSQVFTMQHLPESSNQGSSLPGVRHPSDAVSSIQDASDKFLGPPPSTTEWSDKAMSSSPWPDEWTKPPVWGSISSEDMRQRRLAALADFLGGEEAIESLMSLPDDGLRDELDALRQEVRHAVSPDDPFYNNILEGLAELHNERFGASGGGGGGTAGSDATLIDYFGQQEFDYLMGLSGDDFAEELEHLKAGLNPHNDQDIKILSELVLWQSLQSNQTGISALKRIPF